MTSSDTPLLTDVRPRLTSEGQEGHLTRSLTLGQAAIDGLQRVTGRRPAEEFVVLTAAATIVLGYAEYTEEPSLIVNTDTRPQQVTVRLSELTSLADAIRAVDNQFKQPHSLTEPDADRALTVSTRRISTSEALRGAMNLTLSGDARPTLDLDFDTARIESWFADVLLRSIETTLAACNEPRQALEDIAFFAKDDLSTVNSFARANYVTQHPTHTVLDRIAERANANPESIAVIAGEETTTYGELWQKSHSAARRLRDKGIGAGDFVAILPAKEADTLAAILGTLLTRAAYVPLDRRWPTDRIAGILVDVDAAAVVAPAHLQGQLPDAPEPPLDTAALTAPDSEPAPVNDLEVELDDTVYVVYTSGSTGMPKGVPAKHLPVTAYFDWKVRYHEIDTDSVILQTAALAFDGGTSDVFSALTAGACLVLIDIHKSTPKEVGDLVVRHRVTHLHTVPSLYRMIVDELARGADCLRLNTMAGEATDLSLVRRHHELLPNTRLVNEYGPTEACIAQTAFDHYPDAGPGYPIGKPLDHCIIEVIGRDSLRLPAGFVGQLQLSGICLADGYINQPEQSASAFLSDPDVPEGRVYRTGDLGWWRSDGLLEFSGRTDSQVKIRGYRVELGEVEGVLNSQSDVSVAAVVATVHPERGSNELVAFLEQPHGDLTEIRAAIARQLAPAMVPSHFESVPRLPRLGSNKPNRTTLSAQAATILAATSVAAGAEPAVESPQSHIEALERVVCEVLENLLKSDPVKPSDDFFALGGHSLLAISAVGKLEERTGVRVDLEEFLSAETVGKIAVLLEKAGASGQTVPTGTNAQGPGPAGDSSALWNLLDQGEKGSAANG